MALFDTVMTKDDRFILSKGHACWPYYVLLRERGFNPELAGHPSRDVANGIFATTGSEGHGLPIGIGMATAWKYQHRPGRIFVLLGDGECQEGSFWESLQVGSRLRLNNLVAIVDANSIQGSDFTYNILPIPPLPSFAEALDWRANITSGHDIAQLIKLLSLPNTQSNPRLIVAETVKGKGVSYMEGQPKWHARTPNKEELAIAHAELAPI